MERMIALVGHFKRTPFAELKTQIYDAMLANDITSGTFLAVESASDKYVLLHELQKLAFNASPERLNGPNFVVSERAKRAMRQIGSAGAFEHDLAGDHKIIDSICHHYKDLNELCSIEDA